MLWIVCSSWCNNSLLKTSGTAIAEARKRSGVRHTRDLVDFELAPLVRDISVYRALRITCRSDLSKPLTPSATFSASVIAIAAMRSEDLTDLDFRKMA